MGVWKNRKKGYWVAKFQHYGKQIKKEGFKKKSEAQAWESEERERLRELASKTPLVSFQKLATDYLTHCKIRFQYNTVRQKVFVFRILLQFVGGDIPASEVTPKQVSDFITARAIRCGNKCANRDLKEIKALYNWATNHDLFYSKNPCRSIEKLPEDPFRKYIPPSEDIMRVKLVASPAEREFIDCLYHLLARKSEITRLTWEDVNFEEKWVRLYTRKRRGGELQEDYMPMNETLFKVLYGRWERRNKESQNVFDFNERQLRYMMERLCKKSKVKPFGFHAIRHYVASILNDSKKASMKQIQKLLRHRRQATTETYLHEIEGSLHEAISILDEKFEKSSTLSSTPNSEIMKRGV